MSNEKEIREAVKFFLMDNLTGIIVDEFTGGTMKTRPDLAMLGEYFIFVEIKSDKDSLTRLENQVTDYRRYCDEVVVILDEKHRKEYEKKYRKSLHWHTIGFYKDGVINFERNILSRFQYSDIGVLPDLPNLLWAEERRRLLIPLGKVPNAKEHEAIQYCYTQHELDKLTREIIIDRWDWLSKQERRFNHGFSGGNIKSQIKHIDHKRILIDEFICMHGIKFKELKRVKPKPLIEMSK